MGLFSFKAKTISPEIVASWYAGKKLNPEADWFSARIPNWVRIFSALPKPPRRILEVGSYEGRSAIFFLNFFKNAELTCIDPLKKVVTDSLRPNLEEFGLRARVIMDRSTPILDTFARNNEKFDIIYIDGDHYRDQVLLDSVQAWSMLTVGGLMIWDDYDWPGAKTPEENPKRAIDSFLFLNEGNFEFVDRGYQIFVRKTRQHQSWYGHKI